MEFRRVTVALYSRHHPLRGLEFISDTIDHQYTIRLTSYEPNLMADSGMTLKTLRPLPVPSQQGDGGAV